MKESQSFVINDDYNQWYREKITAFAQSQPNIKEHPELWEKFKFDLNQAKIDTVQITNETLAFYECASRLKTGADIHCIGRTTIHDLTKKEY